MKKVLIIGGTGRLSKDVAYYAAKCNMEVYCLTRGTFDRRMFVIDSCKMLYADIRDDEGCRKAIGDMLFDTVIDFISYEPTHLKNKLELLYNHYKQYIFISSATVYIPSDNIHGENTSHIANNGWQYSRDKILCEKYLKDYFQYKKELVYTIIRPYVTYGNTRIPYPIVPFDSQKEWSLIYRIICGKKIPIMESDNVITLTHSRDFAKGLIGLVANSYAYNEDFHITSQDIYKWEDVIDLCSDAIGKSANKQYIPVKDFVEKAPEYSELLIYDKLRNWRFDNSKIISAVPNFKCEIKLQEGIKDMVIFYVNRPEIQKVDLEWDKKIDLLCAGM